MNIGRRAEDLSKDEITQIIKDDKWNLTSY